MPPSRRLSLAPSDALPPIALVHLPLKTLSLFLSPSFSFLFVFTAAMKKIDPYVKTIFLPKQRALKSELRLDEADVDIFETSIASFRESYATTVNMPGDLIFDCAIHEHKIELVLMTSVFLNSQGNGKRFWPDHTDLTVDRLKPQYSKDSNEYVDSL